MKTIATTLLAACLLGLTVTAFAGDGDEAPRTWLLVRSGAATTDANYTNEDRDINDKLQEVSVLCKDIEETRAEVTKLVNSDKSRNWGQGPTWSVSRVSTVIGQGGKVIFKPLKPKNPNHCVINDLTLGKIKGIWHDSP
jgi:hypothetical protein